MKFLPEYMINMVFKVNTVNRTKNSKVSPAEEFFKLVDIPIVKIRLKQDKIA